MAKEKIDFRIVIVALLCITVLGAIALLKGINGLLLTTVIGVIALAAGVALPQVKFK
ncbi:MAG: hypothetical protein KAJ19_26030 [Gammaproteobacteria bacterium]|nr:hypothetical protein [Gammaproteobacteria bacterium]